MDSPARVAESTRREWWLRAAITVAVVGGLLAALLNIPGQRYNWHSVWRDGGFASYLLWGLGWTLGVSLGAMVVGLVFGVLGARLRMSRHIVPNQIGTLYVELVRGTPLLVQIMIAFYCVAVAAGGALDQMGAPGWLRGLADEEVLVGILTLGIFAGAYVAEIVRAALESIDRGQMEAALSQGMTPRQALRLVLLPQALRRMLPPLAGQFVSLVKDSSLLSVIGVLELTQRASIVRASTYTTFEVLLPLAGLYLLITFPLSWGARRLEQRLT